MRGSNFHFMPAIAAILAVALCSCTESQEENQLALQLREDFLSMTGCSGQMKITADYGQRIYSYAVTFSSNEETGMTLVLTAPEEVAGITATIEHGQTNLVYDGVRLETGPLNEDGLSPLDALPTLITAVQSGCLMESGSELLGETDTLRLCYRDPEQTSGEGTETILWFCKDRKTLLRGALLSNGSTVIRCEFSAFNIISTNT